MIVGPVYSQDGAAFLEKSEDFDYCKEQVGFQCFL